MLVLMLSEGQSKTWSLPLDFEVKHQVAHAHCSTPFMVFSVTCEIVSLALF